MIISEEELEDRGYKKGAFLDLSNVTRETFLLMSRKVRKKITSMEDIKSLPRGFIKLYGKIGFRFRENNEIFYSILDSRYIKDKNIRDFVDKRFVTPEYKKLSDARNRRKGIINLVRIAEASAVVKLLSKLEVTKITMRKFTSLLKPSEKEIKKYIIKSVLNGRTPPQISIGIKEGVRLNALQDFKSSTAGKYCRMTTTSAENPDETHLHLEGIVMTCEEISAHLERPGCQHNAEVVDLGALSLI